MIIWFQIFFFIIWVQFRITWRNKKKAFKYHRAVLVLQQPFFKWINNNLKQKQLLNVWFGARKQFFQGKKAKKKSLFFMRERVVKPNRPAFLNSKDYRCVNLVVGLHFRLISYPSRYAFLLLLIRLPSFISFSSLSYIRITYSLLFYQSFCFFHINFFFVFFFIFVFVVVLIFFFLFTIY